MITLKNFSIFKGKQSENEKAPTHRISIKVGDNYLDAGACWTKQDKNGNKFLSAKLADAYVDHTDNSKSRKSVVLVFEEDLKALHTKAGEDYINEVDVPATKPTKQAISSVDAF